MLLLLKDYLSEKKKSYKILKKKKESLLANDRIVHELLHKIIITDKFIVRTLDTRTI